MRVSRCYLVAVAFLLTLVAAYDLMGQIDLGLALDYPSTEASNNVASSAGRVVYNVKLTFPDGNGANRKVTDVLDGATTEDKMKQLVRASYRVSLQPGLVLSKPPTFLLLSLNCIHGYICHWLADKSTRTRRGSLGMVTGR